MLKRQLDTILVGVILLCSTSFYSLAFLGPLQKGSELLGGALIIVLIVFHLVYSENSGIKQNFSGAIVLILIALVTSMVTAYVLRDQRIMHTMFAQRALYYYFLYFLLHQMNFDKRDVMKLLMFFAGLYIFFHFLQTILFPKLLFNANIRADRGTIRIYLPGADYIAAAFYFNVQRFFRSNKLRYLIFLLVILSVYVMRGGRQSLAIITLMVVLFMIFDRKVKSRFFLIILWSVGAFSVFLIFQNIFLELFMRSRYDLAAGDDYIRIQSARYYLTDFFESPIAYISGNGMYYLHSDYGKLFRFNNNIYNYHLGDIGLIGNYVIYGLFFVLGVFIIFFRAFTLKIEPKYVFVTYVFIDILISLITSGGFGESDFICYIVLILYLMDTSNHKVKQTAET